MKSSLTQTASSSLVWWGVTPLDVFIMFIIVGGKNVTFVFKPKNNAEGVFVEGNSISLDGWPPDGSQLSKLSPMEAPLAY